MVMVLTSREEVTYHFWRHLHFWDCVLTWLTRRCTPSVTWQTVRGDASTMSPNKWTDTIKGDTPTILQNWRTPTFEFCFAWVHRMCTWKDNTKFCHATLFSYVLHFCFLNFMVLQNFGQTHITHRKSNKWVPLRCTKNSFKWKFIWSILIWPSSAQTSTPTSVWSWLSIIFVLSTTHPPIRTSSDFNSNFSLYNFQARAMLGSSLASW